MNISHKRVNNVKFVCIVGSCFAGTVYHNAGSVCLFQKVLIINVGQEFTNKWMNSVCIYRVAQKMYAHFDMKNVTL